MYSIRDAMHSKFCSDGFIRCSVIYGKVKQADVNRNDVQPNDVVVQLCFFQTKPRDHHQYGIYYMRLHNSLQSYRFSNGKTLFYSK